MSVKCKKQPFYSEKEFIRTVKDVLETAAKRTGHGGFFNPLDVATKQTLYVIVYGERSNGKSFGALVCAIVRYILYGEHFAIIRRWDEDFNRKSIQRTFGGLQKLGLIKYLTHGEYDHIYAESKMFYLAGYDENGNRYKQDDPIGYAFALTQMEHDKGGNYPGDITTVIFDEFLTRGAYLPDEMALFSNVLSTILRADGEAKIWMLGNTVSRYCPYFREMGLRHVLDMEPGDTQHYTGTRDDCTILVHYADGLPEGKSTDKYFAFDNPRLKMITEGKYETAIYPHKPCEFQEDDKVFTFFIVFNGSILRGDVIVKDDMEFLWFTPKTTELKYPDEDLIFSDADDPRPNWRRRITVPATPEEKAIVKLIRLEKAFFLDNECGEFLRTYINWCNTKDARR